MSACRCGQYELGENVTAMRVGSSTLIHRESHCSDSRRTAEEQAADELIRLTEEMGLYEDGDA